MKTLTEVEMFALLIKTVDEAGGQAKFLRQYEIKNVSRQYLNDIIKGRRAVPPYLLPTLGLERVVSYRKIKDA